MNAHRNHWFFTIRIDRIYRFYLHYQFAITTFKRVEMQTHASLNARASQQHLNPFQSYECFSSCILKHLLA